ncbi:MAG: hypothetical protein H0X13_05135 [Ramlibacter sp.]|nr:hypothetical protein [Ramlibacter sp.]
MKKLLHSVLLAATLATSASAMAQASGFEGTQNQPAHGPLPGTPEYYGNSGWTPPSQPVYVYVPRSAAPAYPYVVPVRPVPVQPAIQPVQPTVRDRDRDRDGMARNRDRDGNGIADRRERDLNATARNRDRDGDGIANRDDRYPDDPNRR